MADTPAYVVVDHILKSENEQITEQNTFNVSFTELVEGDRDAIADWIKEDIRYDELKNAPALPPDTNNESSAYETVSGERKIKGFKEIAFTGEYNDLSGAPGIPVAGYENGQVKDFNPVAFTGITNLGNVQVSEVLDLRNYGGGVDALGQDSVYIDGMPQGLGTAVAAFCTGFDTNKGKKPYYIITNAVTGGKVYQVLNVGIQKDGPDTLYYKIDVANVNTSSYPYVNGSKGDSVLENIEITSKLGCFIFDLVNNCIYYKSENVNADIELPELADVAISGSYEDLENKPNLDASDNNTDISGLATVATTGSFDDLEDQQYIFNPGQFIYSYDSNNNNWTILTGEKLTMMQGCGFVNSWIKNINNLYKEEDNSEENSLIYELKKLVIEFNIHKSCYLLSGNESVLITHLIPHYSGDNLINLTIQCAPTNKNNYNNALLNNDTSTDENITEVFNSIITLVFNSVLIIDFNKKIFYSIYKRIFPAFSGDYSIVVTPDNIIRTNLSAKDNNKLEIIEDINEEGLYCN